MHNRHQTYSIRNGLMTPVPPLARRGTAHPPVAGARAAKPKAPQSREDQIRCAVDQARRMEPSIGEGYAARAIMSGRSIEEIKADLFDLVSVDGRATSKANMLTLVSGDRESNGDRARSKANMVRLLRGGAPEPKGAA